MLGRQVVHALKALLAMAADPPTWRSVQALAASQGVPAPMLEQLLLKLRRAGLLEARRGRLGGYRLARAASAIPLADVLAALGHRLGSGGGSRSDRSAEPGAADQVAALVEQRLKSALEREMARCNLAELLFDLRSASAELSDGGGLLLG